MIQNEELSLGSTDCSPAPIHTDADSAAMAHVYLNDRDSLRRSPQAEERARRLVACWNALIGVSTEDVESMAADARRKRESLAADEALVSTTPEAPGAARA